MEAAMAPDAPRLFEEWPDNLMVDVGPRNPDVERLLSTSRVVRGRFAIQRHAAVPIETRASLAEYRMGSLTMWTTAQSPHITRTTLSYVLPIPERNIRVIAPDVGGAFGCKCHVYPEEVLVCWLAKRLERPVRWTEDRGEHMTSTAHSRDHVIEVEAALGDDGTFTAIRTRIVQDVGSGELFFPGHNPSFVASGHMTGPYRIAHAESRVTCVVTNKTPSGAFRGFGIPEAVFAVERMVEKAAKETGTDPVELRRKMLVRPEDLPYVTATGGVLDSGSFVESFERAVELGRKAEQRARSSEQGVGARIGVGYAAYIEGTAPTYFGTTGHWTSHDACTIRVEPDGGVVVSVGVTTTGQGTTTMVATLAADALGIPRDDVKVQIGDTDLCPYGLGGWGSRSTVIGGGAVLKAAAIVREKALRIAGHVLEAAPEDLVIDDGLIHVRGSTRPSVTMADVGRTAWVRTVDLPPDIEPGLEAAATYDPPGLEHFPDELGRMNGAATWANATHAAVVRVGLDDGRVDLLEYAVVHDCGPLINPQIVEGQVVGGVAQGIGGTLLEHLVYSEEGQPIATTFMDYLIPTASEIPPLQVEHLESPSPSMPLGVKGAGEGGIIGPPAAIANAVGNALAEFGIEIDTMPITPASIRAALRAAGIEGGAR